MKKILILCMATMLVGGLAFSQAQDPGLSNTVITGFGTTDEFKPGRGDPGVKFFGLANYFTANIEIGKLVIAGDIVLKLDFNSGFTAAIKNQNFNVIIKPFTGLDIGIGTNLEWEVGPAPSSGPTYSAYNVPYYAGLEINRPSAHNYPNGAAEVKNYFGDRSLAIRYSFEDIIQVGFALNHGSTDNAFDGGLGIKLNILDAFTIGVAYNGNFKKNANNTIYAGSTISAITNLLLDIWWNFVPKAYDTATHGHSTIGARVDFTAGKFRLAPEFSITFGNDKNYGPAMYIALDMYGKITNEMRLGLNASWGVGSDYLEASDVSNTRKAGARLNINPYFIWNLNATNELSIGAYLMPVWWQQKASDGERTDFYWSIPIAWKVNF